MLDGAERRDSRSEEWEGEGGQRGGLKRVVEKTGDKNFSSVLDFVLS
ncbi:hypothetical protein MIDIC_70078 [Alphaproteobacteria bacterium]